MRTSFLTSLSLLGALGIAHPHNVRREPDNFHLTERDATSGIKSPTPQLFKREITGNATWSPPSNITKALSEVWEHEIKTYSEPLTFKNYGFDQVMAGKGNINYCVRWDANSTVSAEQRKTIANTVDRSYNKWISALAGFEGFPYDKVNVSVVGWAVKDKSLLQGDTSDIDVYTTRDADGVPECSEDCGRSFHLDEDYSSCPGGANRHYDNSLWLTEGLDGGFGGDWGQQVGVEYFLETMNDDNVHILLHEMGHTFALDDFYDWTPDGVTNFIMLAGSAFYITPFDAWMARDWWRHLKSRYSL